MDYLEYIQPELLILIPVLYCIGAIIKHWSGMDNKWIPALLGLLGILLAALYVLAQGVDSYTAAAFTAIVQGILCAGAAVYGHELIKQTGE